MQPFEKHKELADSILFAAHNWKISTGWTNHLEQINKVCIQNEELLEGIRILVERMEENGLGNFPSVIKYRQLYKQLK